MNEDEIEKAILHYRSLVKKEVEKEKTIDGKLVGPRKLVKKDYPDLKDIIQPERLFLGKDATEDQDSLYVTTFRVGNLKKPISLAKAGYGTDVVAGIEMGTNLVKNGIIKSFDDIGSFLTKYKMVFLIFSPKKK